MSGGAPIDPGDQDHGRVKRRGISKAKDVGQGDLLSGTTPPPANSGTSTGKWHPETSRKAAVRASENLTAKQLAVLSIFHLAGSKEMNDEELCDRYRSMRNAMANQPNVNDLMPEQTDSGIRSRRSELCNSTMQYLEYAGYKRRMKTGGEGRVHRIRAGVRLPAAEDLRR